MCRNCRPLSFKSEICNLKSEIQEKTGACKRGLQAPVGINAKLCFYELEGVPQVVGFNARSNGRRGLNGVGNGLDGRSKTVRRGWGLELNALGGRRLFSGARHLFGRRRGNHFAGLGRYGGSAARIARRVTALVLMEAGFQTIHKFRLRTTVTSRSARLAFRGRRGLRSFTGFTGFAAVLALEQVMQFVAQLWFGATIRRTGGRTAIAGKPGRRDQ
jgi:hypothetical protein